MIIDQRWASIDTTNGSSGSEGVAGAAGSAGGAAAGCCWACCCGWQAASIRAADANRMRMSDSLLERLEA